MRLEEFPSPGNKKDKMISRVKALFLLAFLTGIFVFMRGFMMQQPQLQDASPSVESCHCEKCFPEDDQWFVKRFDKSVEPFLSTKYNLPVDAFNWWRGLQYEKRNYDVYNKTVERLFQIFPPSPDVLKPSREHCRRCAVVGNSGNLKGSRYGPLINAHEIIIRMNTGKTEGYEADVGSRTTHRIMYPESAIDLDNSTHLVLFPFKIQDIEWLNKAFTTGFHGSSYVPVRAKIKANKDLVMVVNPAFMKYVHQTWLDKKGRYSSTGFMALVLALHICDEVDVFGFGADKDGNWSHYWEQLKNKRLRTGVHPGSQEYEAILRLAKLLIIKFYRGW
ncbi:CMP-N-acetylneuraminate-beta-galactosamide-alpha-2,3-sialyltransferase 1 [Labrus bergylta]|uniref:CMP-N-acetylneuraminate-beta-galactosamide- alpha-2,3-sialyltransferase 1 n=1 Tax=Labrus bergylta TaxID=56723 RepID=UPI003313707E